MGYRYRKHYTRDEARVLLPQIRAWLKQVLHLRNWLAKADDRLGQLLAKGHDAGGELVNDWLKMVHELRNLLAEFQKREIIIKDVESGLVDFPAIIGGREVFLCWERDEDDVEYWHDLDAGKMGRERL